MAKNLLTFLIVSFLATVTTSRADQVLKSPYGTVVVQLTDAGGNLVMSQSYRGKAILTKSRLGLVVDGLDFSTGVSIGTVTTRLVYDTWNAINEKTKKIRNHYVQYKIVVNKTGASQYGYQLIFRLYNDGFAYRYKLSKSTGSDSLEIAGEMSKLLFPDDFTYWAYNGERPNVGPLRRSAASRDSVRTPVVIKTASGAYMAIHEAAIVQCPPFDLTATGTTYSLDFQSDKAKYAGPVLTNWRVFILGNRPGDLVESNLLVNLNEPTKITDTSWIRPGKAVWDWRVLGYKAPDGFVYGLNTESHKRLINFAGQNNIQFLVIDANWYGDESSAQSDPTKSAEGVTIEETIAFARHRNVGVILYLNDKGAKLFGLDRILKQFADWGAVGVKYGFMRGTNAEKVAQTRRVVELCARYQLMVDFHDNPIKPSGEQRTWPNLMAREFCHAQTDGKRSYFPETMVSSAFINMIAGHLDYTNGWFDLNKAESREKVFADIPGTVSAEVAKLIVALSGWMVLPDSPEEYLKKPDLFNCIRLLPAKFDTFQVLDGAIDDYIVVARRAGQNWFVGSLTNRQGRELELDLSFLPKGKTYQATLYEDTKTTHFLTNKESYRVVQKTVNSTTKLRLKLAPGGGHAMYLEPARSGN